MLQGVENVGPSSYGKPNTYLLRHTQHDVSNFFISVLLYYTLQVSFNTVTLLRSAVREAKHTSVMAHIIQ